MDSATTRSAMLLAMNRASGWEFCKDLTQAVRAHSPRALQNAEYWPGEYGAPADLMVAPIDNRTDSASTQCSTTACARRSDRRWGKRLLALMQMSR